MWNHSNKIIGCWVDYLFILKLRWKEATACSCLKCLLALCIYTIFSSEWIRCIDLYLTYQGCFAMLNVSMIIIFIYTYLDLPLIHWWSLAVYCEFRSINYKDCIWETIWSECYWDRATASLLKKKMLCLVFFSWVCARTSLWGLPRLQICCNLKHNIPHLSTRILHIVRLLLTGCSSFRKTFFFYSSPKLYVLDISLCTHIGVGSCSVCTSCSQQTLQCFGSSAWRLDI